MHSRELGLVLAQQLLDVDDLHYGWWEEGEQPTMGKLRDAQERYSQRLVEVVERHCPPGGRVLDVGCGTGHLMEKMLVHGFEVDGVIPALWLEQRVHERIARLQPTYRPTVFPCMFEKMPQSAAERPYDIVLFSESFQYIPLADSLPTIRRLLKPGGKVVVCDFFKTEHHGDGQPGDKSFGGGHKLYRFHAALDEHRFAIEQDEDITRYISPSVALVDEMLRTRIAPACGSIDRYITARVPRLRRFVGWLLRRKLAKLRYKYLEENRTQAVFERYKSYRLLVLKPE